MANHPMFGNSAVDDFKFGSSQVDRVYHGSSLVWQHYIPVSVTARAVSDIAAFPAAASGSSTATAIGGSGTITYSWTKVSGTTLLVGNSTQQTASFSTGTSKPIGTYNAVYKVTATDGTSTDDDTINVTLEIF